MADNDPPPTVVVQPSQGVVGVAADTIGALRGSPTLLVMVLLNVVFIGAATYFITGLAHDVGERQRLMLERCLDGKGAAP